MRSLQFLSQSLIDPGQGGFYNSRLRLLNWWVRITGTVVGSVSRTPGVMLGLSGRVVLWEYACLNIDTVFQDDYFFYMRIHPNTKKSILPFS